MSTRVAYLTSQYPALSHAFIEAEIAALRRCGVEVVTHSVRPCPPQELRSSTMRAEAARTRTLRGTPPGEWATAIAGLARRRPDVLAAGLRLAARSGHRAVRTKTWQLFYLAEAALLYKRMRADGLRHVHAHFANVGSDVARLTVGLGRAEDGPRAGWRWSFTMHGPTEFEDVAHFDLAAKVRSADGVSCISDFCRSQLMRFVEPEHWGKMRVVRMAVDTNRYHPAPSAPPAWSTSSAPSASSESAGSGSHTPAAARLLSVGRLVPEKGTPVLLEAIALLADRGIRTNTSIVGAGALAEPLAAQRRRLGLENLVGLAGPLGQDELPERYRGADVFVLPSFSEGLPVVLMEAMASGLPVVTTQIAAVGELVQDGVTGRIVPAGRADLFADALADVLADPVRAQAWGRAGRERVCTEFTTDVTGPAMAAFLEGVTG